MPLLRYIPLREKLRMEAELRVREVPQPVEDFVEEPAFEPTSEPSFRPEFPPDVPREPLRLQQAPVVAPRIETSLIPA